MDSIDNAFSRTRLALALERLAFRPCAWPALAALWPGLALGALPSGGTVTAGAASISNPDPDGLRITQTSDRAVINWQSFSIGGTNYVQFSQPGSTAVVLNRVVGGNPSSILGTLSANGQVFLVNPNGMYFAPGATIDVAGLVATTLAIRDQDFMAGNYVFSRDPASPARAEVVNQGMIAARDGGYVVLAGDYAANTGVIQARLGTVALAAGSKLTLDLFGDRLVNLAVNERTLANLAGVSNAGQLLADGGRVVMTAAVAGDLAATAVNHEGLARARSTVEHGGEIYLTADGGSIAVAGTLDARALPGAHGGRVEVVAKSGNTTLSNGAEINVSGADIAVSNAGSVYAWADGVTRFQKDARIYARGGAEGGDGGFVEVSGKQVAYRGLVDARAPKGKMGTILLDPYNIVIADGNAGSDATGTSGSTVTRTIYEQHLEGQLQLGSVDLVASSSGNASITMQDLTDGVLDGRNAGAGGGLTLRAQATGFGNASISFNNTNNQIKVDGALTLQASASNGLANINVGNLVSTAGPVDVSAVALSAATVRITANAGSLSVRNVSALSTSSAASINLVANDGAIVQYAGGLIKASGRTAQVTIDNNTLSLAPDSPAITLNGSVQALAGSSFGSSGFGSITVRAASGKITVNELKATTQSYSYYAAINVLSGNSGSGSGNIAVNGDVSAEGWYGSSSAGATVRIQTNGQIAQAATSTIRSLAGSSSAYVNIRGGTVNVNGAVLAQASGSRWAQIDVTANNGLTVNALTAIAQNSASGAQINLNGNGPVTTNGALLADARGGYVTVSDIRGGAAAGDAGSGFAGRGAYVNIQNSPLLAADSPAITVNGTVAAHGGMGSSGTGQVYIQAGSGKITVNDVTATSQQRGATIRIYSGGSGSGSGNIAVNGALMAQGICCGTGDAARVQARTNGGLTVAAAASIQVQGSSGVSVDLRGGSVGLDGSIAASGSNGTVDVQALAGDVTVNGTIQSTSQINLWGTNLTLAAPLTANGSSVNLNVSGNVSGSGLITAPALNLTGSPGAGSHSVVTNLAQISVWGGSGLSVNNSAHPGTLTALLGSSGQAIGNASITTGGTLDITRFFTTGNSFLFRADGLAVTSINGMPAGTAIALKPFTLTNTVGVHSATDTDATIQTNYSEPLLNLFPAGSTITVGGVTGVNLTGDIHVGAEGAFNLGDKNIVFATEGSIITHTAPTTTGTVTELSLAVAPPPPPEPSPVTDTGDAEQQAAMEEAGETASAFVSGLSETSDHGAEDNDAAREVKSHTSIGGPPGGGAPQLFQIQGEGVNLFASGEQNGPGTPDPELPGR